MANTIIAVSYFLETLFALSALWLGLFIITRDWTHWRSRFAGSAIILIGLFWGGIALGLLAESPQEFILIHQLTWWGVPIAIACWCTTGLLFLPLTDSRLNIIKRLIAIVAFFVAIIFVFLGTFTNALFDFYQVKTLSEPTVIGLFYLPLSSLGLLYELYNFIGLTINALCITYAYYVAQKDSKEGLGFIALASFLILIGGVTSSWTYSNLGTINLALLSDALIFVALVTTGYSIARYNALVKNRNLTTDFRISALGFMLVLFGFMGVPLVMSQLLNQWIPSFTISYFQLTIVMAIATISIMLIDYIRTAVDKLVEQPSAEFREELNTIIRDLREEAPQDEIEQGLSSTTQAYLGVLIRKHLNKDLLRQFTNQGANRFKSVADHKLQGLSIVKKQYADFKKDAEDEDELYLRFRSLKTVLLKGIDEVKKQHPVAIYGHRHFYALILEYTIDSGFKRKAIIDELFTDSENIDDRRFDELYGQSIQHLQNAILNWELNSRE